MGKTSLKTSQRVKNVDPYKHPMGQNLQIFSFSSFRIIYIFVRCVRACVCVCVCVCVCEGRRPRFSTSPEGPGKR